MFLAFQYPQEIQGVSVLNFLRQALSARKGIDLSMLELRLAIMEWMGRLDMDPSFADRYLNEGFSGGEKKRNEILQMAILEPEMAILDETDSGLDIDALRVVAKGVQEVRAARPELGVLAITHYQRLLDELAPDQRPHHDRRAHRRERRPRAGRPTRSPRGTTHGADRMPLEVRARIKADFPLLTKVEVGGHPIVYLDSASSSQKPRSVHRRHGRASTRRPTPTSTAASTASPPRPPTATRRRGPRWPASSARPSTNGIVFTKNVTEAINLVAYSWGRANLAEGDVVVLTEIEHHANLVPVADPARGARHRAALHPDGRRLHARPDRPRPAARRSQAPRRHRHVQRARHARPRSASWPTPPTPPARCAWSTAPSTSPTCPPT